MFREPSRHGCMAALNYELSMSYLTKILPGIAFSSPTSLSYRAQQPITCYRESASTLPEKLVKESDWSDSESLGTRDPDWPDWSRWSRRKSSTFSQTSVDTSISTEDGLDTSLRSKAHLSPESPFDGSSAASDSKVRTDDAVTKDASAAYHPAKTGFAVWVGNLGPRTTLLDLRTLFGTPDLQSIYLIQRTGCAFVNYNSKEGLDMGLQAVRTRGGKLHDHEILVKAQVTEEEETSTTSSADSQIPNYGSPPSNHLSETRPVRYFICKSLLVDDLELAKKTGQWSTQLRNKDRFNEAFNTSDNIILVFSANRTSAFYGIARLDSPFEDCKGDQTASESKKEVTVSEPEIKQTPMILHPEDGILIPEGTTVLDPLRGSQFWKVSGCLCIEPEVEKWTAPAKITWLSSTNSIVPFSKTRQLKNSLNMNKPIKVARDGTEIDPEIGKLLCQMFS